MIFNSIRNKKLGFYQWHESHSCKSVSRSHRDHTSHVKSRWREITCTERQTSRADGSPKTSFQPWITRPENGNKLVSRSIVAFSAVIGRALSVQLKCDATAIDASLDLAGTRRYPRRRTQPRDSINPTHAGELTRGIGVEQTDRRTETKHTRMPTKENARANERTNRREPGCLVRWTARGPHVVCLASGLFTCWLSVYAFCIPPLFPPPPSSRRRTTTHHPPPLPPSSRHCSPAVPL